MLETNKKFLDKHFGQPQSEPEADERTIENAQQFEAQGGCSAMLWIEYSQSLTARRMSIEEFFVKHNAGTLIMIGFAMGWREAKGRAK